MTADPERDGYRFTGARDRLDLDWMTDAVLGSYWGGRLDREQVRKSLLNSRVFGLLDQQGQQVGMARVVTDGTRFAWLSDVIIAEKLRGRGLGQWLLGLILGSDELRHVDRWLLATGDGHELYRRFGFISTDVEGKFMVRVAGHNGSPGVE
ncbi:MAG: GNAT family N-acetyltransferase [Rhodospirillales bacterium]